MYKVFFFVQYFPLKIYLSLMLAQKFLASESNLMHCLKVTYTCNMHTRFFSVKKLVFIVL